MYGSPAPVSKVYAAGDIVLIEHPANQDSPDDDVYGLMHKVKIDGSGEFRISGEMCVGNASTGYIQIYRSGEAIAGTERTTTNVCNAWVAFSIDIDGWADNETIELWGKDVGGSFVRVKNYKICADKVYSFTEQPI